MRYYLRAHHLVAMISLAAFVILLPPSTYAQSGSRQTGSATRTPISNLAGSPTRQVKIGLEGYCPVCIINMNKWVRGNAAFQSTFDGQTYLFPGQEQKAAFDADPAKYAPALGGDCTVAYKKMGQRVPGSIRHAVFHNKRLYMFSNEMAKNEFAANREMYADVDIALGGKCTVCKIEMQKDVTGKPEFATMYQGMRYYFPGADQLAMFKSNPKKYAVTNAPMQPSGSSTRTNTTPAGAAQGNTAVQGSSKR